MKNCHVKAEKRRRQRESILFYVFLTSSISSSTMAGIPSASSKSKTSAISYTIEELSLLQEV